MVDLPISGAQIIVQSGDVDLVIAGAVITVGKMCYLNDADGMWYPATNAGTALQAGSAGIGFAVGASSAIGQRIGMARPGSVIVLGAASTAVAGVLYYMSLTGNLCPVADVTTTERSVPCALGLGVSTGLPATSALILRVFHPGAIVP
jgi:hypothetical protein